MVIKIITVGKLKEKYFQEAFSEYEKRLGAFCKLIVDETEQEKLPDEPSDKEINKALETEAERILQKIPAGSYVIPLCIEGKQLTSEKFADLIARETANGKNTFVFIIGGSCGLSDRIKQKADFKLSMSEMTFPHRLARVMLAEQLYRAFAIINNRKYHK
ncbi:MAG: 23S rRNA (pseudouridine(1915)-N(3))-methyltransferase RlmH [Ruminiclostridium sp.]|nr:23S rRNA (pseudouridine(1915)-N(3))-methyltransferase RlmH [Ruminiclostridium sp.]